MRTNTFNLLMAFMSYTQHSISGDTWLQPHSNDCLVVSRGQRKPGQRVNRNKRNMPLGVSLAQVQSTGTVLCAARSYCSTAARAPPPSSLVETKKMRSHKLVCNRVEDRVGYAWMHASHPYPKQVLKSLRLEQSLSTAQPLNWCTNVSVLLGSLLSDVAGARERTGEFG